MFRTGVLFRLAATVVLAASACNPAAAPAPTTAPKPDAPAAAAKASGQLRTIRLAVSQLDSSQYSPIYIAQKEGYYRDVGLELDVKPVNPPTAAQALISGQFDIAHAASPGIAAALQGAPLKMIYVIGEPAPYIVIGKKDLKSWTDLKGKTIGVSSTTGTQVLDLTRLLKLNGVDAEADQVKYVTPGGPGDNDKLAALRSGTIDAGLFIGLGIPLAMDEGFSVIGDFSQIRTLDSSLWSTNQFIQSNPDLVQAFVTATLMGMRIYKDNPAKAVPIVTEQFSGNQKAAEALGALYGPRYDDDGIASDATMEEAVQYKREASERPSDVTWQQMVNFDFARKANEEIARKGWKP